MIIIFRNVPHVTILLAWTHRKDDVSLQKNIILTLTSWNSHETTIVFYFVSIKLLENFFCITFPQVCEKNTLPVKRNWEK